MLQGLEPFKEIAHVMIEVCSWFWLTLKNILGIRRAMWQPPWGCYPSMGSSPSQPLGDHQGQLGGQAQWQYPGTSTMPQGHLPGYQNPLATVPGNTPMPFPPAPPMSAISPPIHVGHPIPSPLVNLHAGSELLPTRLDGTDGPNPIRTWSSRRWSPYESSSCNTYSLRRNWFQGLGGQIECSLYSKAGNYGQRSQSIMDLTDKKLTSGPFFGIGLFHFGKITP